MLDVRILPMDKANEHGDREIEEIQNDFFMKDLPSRFDNIGRGKYCYKKLGMKAKKGTTVLFQYDNFIIAMATIENIKKFDSNQDGYYGAYYFEPKSIKIFKPINNFEINKIFKTNKKFSNVKHILDGNMLNDFIESLQNVQNIDEKIIDTFNLSKCQQKMF